MNRLPKTAALIAALTIVAPIPLAHAEAESAPTRTAETEAAARLLVDTSELGTVGPVVRQRMLERGGQVFRDAGVAAGGNGDPRVSVVVRSGPDDEGFAFEIQLASDGRSDATSRWKVDCELCTETELIDSVAAELEKVTVSLVSLATAEAEEKEDATVATPPKEGPQEAAPPDPARDNPGLHRWTKVGIGAAVAGVVVAGAGVALVLLPAKPLDDDPLKERFTQPPGYALLAIGGAALVTGAVLIGLGVKRSKDQRVAVSPGGVTVRF